MLFAKVIRNAPLAGAKLYSQFAPAYFMGVPAATTSFAPCARTSRPRRSSSHSFSRSLLPKHSADAAVVPFQKLAAGEPFHWLAQDRNKLFRGIEDASQPFRRGVRCDGRGSRCWCPHEGHTARRQRPATEISGTTRRSPTNPDCLAGEFAHRLPFAKTRGGAIASTEAPLPDFSV